jgi:hypothetical protein
LYVGNGINFINEWETTTTGEVSEVIYFQCI